MLIKVKTLTGKEIEIDIEPNDKVERIKERVEEKVTRSNGCLRVVGKIPANLGHIGPPLPVSVSQVLNHICITY